jgi:hypothetical protein
MTEIVLAATVAALSLESLPMLDSLLEADRFKSLDIPQQTLPALRIAVGESARYALCQDAQAGAPNVIAFSVIGNRELTPSRVRAEVTFPSRGLVVDGSFPPYPGHTIGLTFLLHELLGCRLYARVEARDILRLLVREEEQRQLPSEFPDLTDRKLGGVIALLALCRSWEEVRMRYDAQLGLTLDFSHPIINHPQGAWRGSPSARAPRA